MNIFKSKFKQLSKHTVHRPQQALTIHQTHLQTHHQTHHQTLQQIIPMLPLMILNMIIPILMIHLNLVRQQIHKLLAQIGEFYEIKKRIERKEIFKLQLQLN